MTPVKTKQPPKKRFPLGRLPRLTIRALALAILLISIVGWTISYRGFLTITRLWPDSHQLALNSYRGRLSISFLNLNDVPGSPGLPPKEPQWSYHVIRPYADMNKAWLKVKPFRLRINEPFFRFSIAARYWLLAWLSAVALALSFKRSWRFSVGELLLATAAMAALFAGIATTIPK
jgi:hypothetical protein